MTLSPQFLDEIRARTLLSALVGRTVKLQRAGREYRACCPFHNEKTPSFYVNDDKGFYHCFGCSAHGDAIRWLTDQRGLAFIDAVKELADAAGMTMPAPDPRSVERAERAAGLHDVMAAAAAWFEQQLSGPDGAEARAYVAARGISDQSRRRFALGYAPDSRGRLRSALGHFGDAMLIEAGLLIAVDDKEPYDRFRGRLMIPIRDPRGRVIAFGGRIIGQGEPKYLNSPDTPLFDKGRTLYNLDLAQAASRKAERVIVVEGYLDVIALDAAGIGETVAPLGTALTEMQLERLWRIAPRPLLCFDGDSAGQRAAVRAAHRALPLLKPGQSLDFVTMPVGQDPDDVVRGGGVAAFDAHVLRKRALVDVIWQHELGQETLATPEARAGFRRRLGDRTASIADRDVRELYQAEFRGRFDELFVAHRPAFRRQPGNRPPGRAVSPHARAIGDGALERMMTAAILAGLVRHPGVASDYADQLASVTVTDRALARLRDVIVEAAYSVHPLDSVTLMPILQQRGVEGIAAELAETNGLAFSFLRGNADAAAATRDLALAIEALAAQPGMEAALGDVTERLGTAPDDDLLAEQRQLLNAGHAATQRLMDAARGDEDLD